MSAPTASPLPRSAAAGRPRNPDPELARQLKLHLGLVERDHQGHRTTLRKGLEELNKAPFEPADAIGLVILIVAQGAARRFLPVGPVRRDDADVCLDFACTCVIAAHPEMCASAGFLPSSGIAYPVGAVLWHFGLAVERWAEHDLQRAVNEAREQDWCPDPATRLGLLFFYERAIDGIGPQKDWPQFEGVIKKVLKVLGWNKNPAQDSRGLPQETVPWWLIFVRRNSEGRAMLHRGEDGMLRLGYRQTRDLLRECFGEPGVWKDSDGNTVVDLWEDADSRVEGESVTQEVMEADLARQARVAVDTVVARRLERTRSGTAPELVLQRAADLLGGTVTPAELARTSSFAESTISEAWKKERNAIEAAPEVRRLNVG